MQGLAMLKSHGNLPLRSRQRALVLQSEPFRLSTRSLAHTAASASVKEVDTETTENIDQASPPPLEFPLVSTEGSLNLHTNHNSTSPNYSSISGDVKSSTSASTDIPPPLQKALKDAQAGVLKQYHHLHSHTNALRKVIANRAKDLGKQAEVKFTALGGTINEVTGYSEVEKLKEQVRERELQIARLREIAAKSKITYDEAVSTRDSTQRSVTSLLERKHLWTDSDVSHFTSLVRSDHSSNLAVAQAKVMLLESETAVEKAFDDMMKAILERYHEEQVWSDKIRSVSTYGSLAVLVVNLIVFVGAILVVEPWKRKTLVRRLEEKVSGMMEKVEGHLARDLDTVKALLAAIPLAQGPEGALRRLEMPDVVRISVVSDKADRKALGSLDSSPGQEAESDISTRTISTAVKHSSTLSRIATSYIAEPFTYHFPSAAAYASSHPRTIDTVIASSGGVLGGIAITSIVMSFLRS